jgi:hypothetical protein
MIMSSQVVQGVAQQSSLLFGNSAALGAAAKAMAELGVAGCIGAFCVQKELVNPEGIRAMSKTSFSVLLPCFLGTGIINTIVTQGGLTADMLGAPLLAIMHSFILFQLSRSFLLPLFGIDKDTTRGRSTAVLCSWGNSGVVPLIFSEALFRYQPDILAQCYSAVSLYLVGWSPFFWSFGRSVLVGTGDDAMNDDGLTSMAQTIKTIKRLASPPVKGVLTGMALALSPLGKLLVSTTPQSNSAALSVVFNSFQNLGRAANPLGLLVLTASLAMGVSTTRSASSTSADDTAKNKNFPALQRWSCVALARFVISPPLMFGLLKGFERLGLIASSAENPVIWFILLLQSCMPPAQNSVLMLQVADKPDEANRLAQFLFSMYATSMLPVIVIVGIMLQAFKLAP